MKEELKEKRASNFVRSDILSWILVSSLLSSLLTWVVLRSVKENTDVESFIWEHFPKKPHFFGIINTVIPAKY